MEKIINSLCINEDKFNYEAVKLARENKGKINKLLLELVEEVCRQLDEGCEYIPLYFDYAVYLLAEFRDTRLFPLLIKILDRETTDFDEIIGYGVMDKLPSIIVSVFDNDFESINKILKNGNIEGYTRAMVMSSYRYFYLNKLISEDDLIDLLRELIEIYKYDDEWIYGSIMPLVADLHIFPMIDDVKMMFRNGAVDLQARGGYDSFIDDIFDYDDRYRDKVYLIDDIVKEMSWWACFKNEEENQADTSKLSEKFAEFVEKDLKENMLTSKKVGRNEPCPCGSGKKYKQCCGK